MGMSVRTAELQQVISISTMRASGPWEAVVRTIEVKSEISILVVRASGPILTNVQKVIFELRFLPYWDARPDGILHRPDGWSIFPQLACGQFGHLIKNFFSYQEFLETKSQRRKDVPYRGAVDNAHFSSHEKISYPIFCIYRKTLGKL
jgi:hypothetical protein